MFVAVRLNCLSYPMEVDECAELQRAGAEIHSIEGKLQEILSHARDCDALLVVASRVPSQVIEQLTKCRIISRLGAGTDNVDVDAATRCGIVVSNVPDFCIHEQAEHTMALLLAWARRLTSMFDAMQTGKWSARHHPQVRRLAGQTLGLIGFGNSAQAVAQRALAFQLRVLAFVRNSAKYEAVAVRLGVQLVDLETLLEVSDYVSLHVPLTDETRHLMNAEKLGRMKNNGVLINTSRGALVEETALVAALRDRRIAGAALDVFEGIDVFATAGKRPVHPFYELDNVLMTPHCAGSSIESTRDSKIRGARHAACVLRGQWPPHVVNADVIPRVPLRGGG